MRVRFPSPALYEAPGGSALGVPWTVVLTALSLTDQQGGALWRSGRSRCLKCVKCVGCGFRVVAIERSSRWCGLITRRSEGSWRRRSWPACAAHQSHSCCLRSAGPTSLWRAAGGSFVHARRDRSRPTTRRVGDHRRPARAMCRRPVGVQPDRNREHHTARKHQSPRRARWTGIAPVQRDCRRGE